jgi:hypothetical protein
MKIMLKNILKLEEIQELSKNEQKNIHGKGCDPQMCYCPALGYTVECYKFDMVCPLDY